MSEGRTTAEERATMREALAKASEYNRLARDVRRLIDHVDALETQAAIDVVEIQAYSELLDELCTATGGENYVDAVRLAKATEAEIVRLRTFVLDFVCPIHIDTEGPCIDENCVDARAALKEQP